MKKIMIISTGGTIAMRENSKGLAQPSLDSEQLVETIRGAQSIAQIDTLSWSNIPGAHMRFKDILELANILLICHGQGFDGAVITHGTDTLEETAYFLDLVCDFPMSIVVTGSQRNSSQLSSDGPVNIHDSVLVAAEDRAKRMGTLVVFNSEAHAARDVTKTHSMKVETFQSPEFGPLAVISNSRVIWYRQPLIKENYKVGSVVNGVHLYRVCIDDDPAFLDAIINAGAKGVVLETLGGGHVPPALIAALEGAVDSYVPVVLTSRCCGRLFTNTYSFIGSENHLRQLGAIWGDGLSGIKARVKLTVLLSAGLNIKEIKREMEKNMYM